jgi:organic radical activating enzyme
MSEEDCLSVIGNLPESIDRLILSGGEPLAERKKLYHILDAINRRYGNRTQVMIQTNGDLLTERILDTLIEKGVSRFDIASIDRYHKHAGQHLDKLRKLFESRGVSDENSEPLIEKETYLKKDQLSWGYWGASEDMWLGGNWARGRALQKKNWKRDPEHNFCSILSGARNFLGGYGDIPQEISIQLWRINPCCPGTKFPLGDARKEKVADVLKRVMDSPVFKKLNEGDPLGMGEHLGVSREEATSKNRELGNVCLYCDHFFEHHMQHLNPLNDHGSTLRRKDS